MKLSYYPGCTLKDKTTNLDRSTIAAAEKLGVELVELSPWTCCGTTHPLTREKIANLIPQIRIMANTKRSGADRLTTTCAFCYSTLKRANRLVSEDELMRRRVNAFLREDVRIKEYDKEKTYEYEDYNGEVKVLHFLEFLRDEYGFGPLQDAVKRPLKGLRVAPYYGCKLLRPPKEIKLDDPEHPTILEDFLRALGCTVIDYPFKTECCGAYLSVPSPAAAARLSRQIIHAATQAGADLLVLSCPLCYYNMDRRQELISQTYPGFKQVPILFFTQLLALALEVDEAVCEFDSHYIDPSPLLKEKGCLC